MATLIPLGATNDAEAVKRLARNVLHIQQDCAELYAHLLAFRDSGGGNNWTAVQLILDSPDITEAGNAFNKIVTLYGQMNTAATGVVPLLEP